MPSNFRKRLPHILKRAKFWEKQNRQAQERLSFDQQLVWQQTKRKRIPSLRQLKYISSFFSAREQAIILASLGVMFVSILAIGFFTYAQFVESVPAPGGNYQEALIGKPLYVNPILASTNDVDLDLTSQIFSGLLRYDQNLTLQPDLAETWSVNEDGTIYSLTLREGVKWHDGEDLQIDDVLFTYRRIQNPAVNSPLQFSIQDVVIEAKDERTLTFTLQTPYSPFASILTTGIIPEHVWSPIQPSNMRLAELNIKPIGSGPFTFDRLGKDKQGNILTYTVIRNEHFYGQKPYLDSMTFRFFSDFPSAIAALNNNRVEGLSFLPRTMVDQVQNVQSYQTFQLELPQYTAVFFNDAKNSALKEDEVRQALAYSIDRDRMIRQVLDEKGEKVNSPLLSGMLGFDETIEGFPYNAIEAKRLLDSAGWNEITADEYVQLERDRIQKERADNNEEPLTEEDLNLLVIQPDQAVFRKNGDEILEIRLTSVEQNTPALNLIRNAWKAIGLKVELEIVPVATFTNDILPTRDYEALLYGQILNVEPDLFAFWHSSQIDHPGLNLAQFEDKEADTLLEEARKATDPEVRAQKQREFQQLLDGKTAAIFLYSPEYTYLLPSKIKGFTVERITVPADRWNNLRDWYVETKRKLKG